MPTCKDTWWWIIHPDLIRWEKPGQALWDPGSAAAPLVLEVDEGKGREVEYAGGCLIKIGDLITTREGACSATLATKDGKIEEREVSEDSTCIKEIGEWEAFLIFDKLASSSVVNDLNLGGLGRGTTPCLERI